MAERRMFSRTLINSARFLRMPAEARLLYYDLGMAADDDGVAEAFTVMRTTGAPDEALKALADKGFVRILNEDLVCYITDWSANNRIRRERHTPSPYAELLAAACPPPEGSTAAACPPDGSRMSVTCPPDGSRMSAACPPDDSQMSAACPPDDSQMSDACLPDDGRLSAQDRLGKDRSGKDSSGQVRRAEERSGEEGAAGAAHTKRFVPPGTEEVAAYCRERGNAVDAQRFVDFYTAKGWRIGRAPMRDWRAAVRTWERKEGNADGSGRDHGHAPQGAGEAAYAVVYDIG